MASEGGIPFIAFRALSDMAGDSSREEFRMFYQMAADNAAAAVIVFLQAQSDAGR